MPTNTEKIDELSPRVAKLETQLENVRKETEGIAPLALQVTKLQVRLDNLRDETKTFVELASKVAVLEQQLKDIKEKTDESSRRRWSLLQIVCGALLGGLITLAAQLIVKYLLP